MNNGVNGGASAELSLLWLDLTGLACPMPIIKLKKFLAENFQKGSQNRLENNLYVVFTDKGGLKDIPAFCQQAGLRCQALDPNDEVLKSSPLSKGQYCLVLSDA